MFFKREECPVPFHPEQTPRYPLPLCSKSVESVFGGVTDLVLRRIRAGSGEELRLYAIDGLTSGDFLSDFVVRCTAEATGSGRELYESLLGSAWSFVAEEIADMDAAASKLVNGFGVLMFDSLGKAIAFEAKTGEKRGISPPESENVVKGAKDSFVETARTNTSLVRRHLRSPELRSREVVVGRSSLTNVTVLYLEELTNPALVDEAVRRIEKIDCDGLLTTAGLEEYLADDGASEFPQTVLTERPDKFCLNLLEGRVGVLVDGIPLGFILPATLMEFLKAPEDKAELWLVAKAVFYLRCGAMLINLLLAGIYVSLACFHQEMIPTSLLLSMIRAKQDVPFSTVFEVLGLLVAFELLQEAGLRLPKNIGQTMSILGGLVVGSAAVEAKIISPVVVIIVAVVGISGFTLPNQDFAGAMRIWRFIIVAAAAVAGLFGMALAVIVLVWRMAGLSTLGVCYVEELLGGGPLLKRPLSSSKLRDKALRPRDLRDRR